MSTKPHYSITVVFFLVLIVPMYNVNVLFDIHDKRAIIIMTVVMAATTAGDPDI